MSENVEYKLIQNWEEISQRAKFISDVEINNDSDAKSKLHKIIAQYQFREKVKCSISMCKTPHNSGYLVILKDENEIIIGKDCGKKYFGIEFTNQKKAMNAKRIQAENYKLLEEYANNLDNLKQQYEQVLNKPNRKKFGFLNREIQKLIINNSTLTYWILRKIKQQVSSNGEIRISVRKSEDEIYLEKMLAEAGTQNKNKYINPDKEEVIATIEGFEIIRKWFDVQKTKNYFDNILKEIKQPYLIADPRKIKKIIFSMREFKDNLIMLDEACFLANKLLEKNNILKLKSIFTNQDEIDLIEKWANSLDDL